MIASWYHNKSSTGLFVRFELRLFHAISLLLSDTLIFNYGASCSQNLEFVGSKYLIRWLHASSLHTSSQIYAFLLLHLVSSLR